MTTCNIPRYMLYNACFCYIVSGLYHCTHLYLLVFTSPMCVYGLCTCCGVSSVIYNRRRVCAAIWCRVSIKSRILGYERQFGYRSYVAVFGNYINLVFL
jgi:hypothetical protein